jgi:UDP-glucose 4-epimerase
MLEGVDVVYHFAAQVSYIDSGNIPFEDLDVNQRATLQLLEICREKAPEARVLFASSRLVVGETQTNPVREDHPTSPQSIYGVHKLAAEKYCEIYWRNFGLRTTVLRITNPYGPRQQMKHGKYSMVGWFVRLAMEEREITIFGDGHQVRNYIYVDDIVEAFARCGAAEDVAGQLFWLGSRENTPFRKMAEMVVEAVGRGSIRYVPWPANYERVETGTVVIDSSRLEQAIGWKAQVSLREGISRTVEYYAEHLPKYAGVDRNG